MIEFDRSPRSTASPSYQEHRAVLDDIGPGLRPTAATGDAIAHHEEAAARIGLSPRELEIVRQVAHDRSNKEIAAVLGISVWTVSTHLRRIFVKLDVHTRAAMVARVVARI